MTDMTEEELLQRKKDRVDAKICAEKIHIVVEDINILDRVLKLVNAGEEKKLVKLLRDEVCLPDDNPERIAYAAIHGIKENHPLTW